MTDDQKKSTIANISDILARNVCMKFEHVATVITTWLEAQEKESEAEAKWYPCYIENDENIIGIAGIRSGDLFALKKLNPEQYPELKITIGNGTKESLSFDDFEKRDAFFDKIKKELT